MTDTEIIDKYPEVFGVRPFDESTTLIKYGFECGEGWYPTLIELIEKISKIVKRDNLENFRAVQVKEKFGGLRFYVNNGTDEIHKLIGETELKCENICEECGAPSKIRTLPSRWVTNLCDTCLNKR